MGNESQKMQYGFYNMGYAIKVWICNMMVRINECKDGETKMSPKLCQHLQGSSCSCFQCIAKGFDKD